LLSSLRIIPAIPFVEKLLPNDELSSGFFSDHVELAFPGLNSLPFLLPFVFATAISRFKEQLWPSVTFLATVPVVLLSGRRAVQVTFMLAPLVTYALNWLSPATERKAVSRRVVTATLVMVAVVGISVVALGAISDVGVTGLKERLGAGFAFSD